MLQAAGVTAFDTDVTSPPAMYAVVTDRDGGLTRAHRMSLSPHWTRSTVDVRLVARTRDGLRALLVAVKRALPGQRLPTGPALHELEASPWMTTGTGGDQRIETVLAYRTTTPTPTGETP